MRVSDVESRFYEEMMCGRLDLTVEAGDTASALGTLAPALCAARFAQRDVVYQDDPFDCADTGAAEASRAAVGHRRCHPTG